MAMASSSGLRSCSAVGVPSLLAPSSRSGRSGLPFCAYATTSGRVTMSAEWFPGQPRPAHLDGSSPGDFGFDPLGLATVPENFERFKESEIYHCRWAMLCVPGVLVPEALGLGNWVKAQEWAALPDGQATYLGNPVPWGNLPTILAIEFLAIAFAEQQRTMEKDPEKKKYPGGAFDPLGFSKDPAKFEELKLKEIKFLEADSEKRNGIFADCLELEEEKNRKQEVDMIKMKERLLLLEQQLLEEKNRGEGFQRVIEMLSGKVAESRSKSLVEEQNGVKKQN